VGRPGGGGTASEKKLAESLISRYSLQERIAKGEDVVVAEDEIGGKAVWEDSAEKREASLRERKAQMILAARQCVFFIYRSDDLHGLMIPSSAGGCWHNNSMDHDVPCCANDPSL